ncbi:glycolipid 2-alpha-mannosyltransferase-domain-containing protein [Syncephalastrum racemosum]|uniref:Glycolipid 2-alpha-mannosyltransferase-domain-containing protein n=1 Tax=Syncephalastrum racemosum TaxID=13706 RepID=A0A1X2H2F0_SYNRA|nr:glycolipid 2-alpha-mannosyltransferase-domain-containing protein [Syncephalastrum racemosum]
MRLMKGAVIVLSAVAFTLTALTAYQFLSSGYARYQQYSTAAGRRLQQVEQFDPKDYPPLPEPRPELCPIDPLSSTRRPDIVVTKNDTRNDTPVNAAIVYLIEFLDRPLEQNHKEMMRFNKALWLLWENFEEAYRYPIMVFHEPAFTPQYQRRYRRMWPRGLDIHFHLVEFSMPPTFPQNRELTELGLHPTNRRAFPGYNHMIHFFFKDIFDHPAIASLDYFWRLDHDSMLESPVGVDVFKYMQARGLKYGYRTVTTDARHVTNGLLTFFDKYRRDPSHHSLLEGQTCGTTSQQNCMDIPTDRKARENYAPLMYYNNFEIIHVPTWRSAQMRELTNAVDGTDMIYWNRWGDAPLRYYAVNMMLDVNTQVMEWCHIKYHHHKTFQPLCNLV